MVSIKYKNVRCSNLYRITGRQLCLKRQELSTSASVLPLPL